MPFEALALEVLTTASPAGKIAAARKAWSVLMSDEASIEVPLPNPDRLPDRPARPDLPHLAEPKDMPRRRLGTEAGRIALLHSLAHIELNAIDLAFDMAARFAKECEARFGLGHEFIKDWIKVGVDEALHFEILNGRLLELGSEYGAHLAHDGLWQAALATKGQWRARLSVVPMVLEARGLDVTPPTITKLEAQGDQRSADILQRIYEDEITHVAAGVKWFSKICAQDNISEEVAFNKDLETFFKGPVKGPFNENARVEAGLLPKLYKSNAQ